MKVLALFYQRHNGSMFDSQISQAEALVKTEHLYFVELFERVSDS